LAWKNQPDRFGIEAHGDLLLAGLYQRPALIIPTLGANRVGRYGGAALWAESELALLQMVVRPTLAGTAVAVSSLGDGHRSSLFLKTAEPALRRCRTIKMGESVGLFTPTANLGCGSVSAICGSVNAHLLRFVAVLVWTDEPAAL
jgi:hypothetical protein